MSKDKQDSPDFVVSTNVDVNCWSDCGKTPQELAALIKGTIEHALYGMGLGDVVTSVDFWGTHVDLAGAAIDDKPLFEDD